MSAAYLATRDVRHLAAWTADDKDRGLGLYRALCGEPKRDSQLVIWPSDLISVDWMTPWWQRRFDAAMRKRVCKKCQATLDVLVGLAAVPAVTL